MIDMMTLESLRFTSILETYTFSPTVKNFVSVDATPVGSAGAFHFKNLLTPCIAVLLAV